MNRHCNICNKSDFTELYIQKNIPLFQNKVYPTEKEAISCATGDIILKQCQCGFVFNSRFFEGFMEYDENYQNEQAHSTFFLEHLNWVENFILNKINKHSCVCEIGCGKGFFVDKLLNKCINIVGCDPAYQGSNKRIKKECFSKNTFNKTFDLLILRHVLEHIVNPKEFLQSIFEANNYKGAIYIEVPCFDWIKKYNAFWDICYEHVNYFTKDFLSFLFPHAEIGHCFGGQYIYVYIKKLEIGCNVSRSFQQVPTLFTINEKYKKIKNLYIWGAGAKGNIFCNVYDKNNTLIKNVIDINCKKQNKFIGGTGHFVISPDFFIANYLSKKVTIIIMNQNYFEEIKKITHTSGALLLKIEDLFKHNFNFKDIEYI